MKKSAALVEFTLTAAMLAFWAIACAAAFEDTARAPGTNGSAGQASSVEVVASEGVIRSSLSVAGSAQGAAPPPTVGALHAPPG